VHVLLVEAALERWIGQDQVEAFAGVAGEAFGEVVAEGILVMDVGGIDAVKHEVHGSDAEHGGVEVEAVEHAGLDVVPVGLEEVAGVGDVLFAIGFLDDAAFLGSVLLPQVFHDADEEAAGATGGVANDPGGFGFHEVDHEADDVAGGAELAVDAGGGELAEQVLVEVTLGIALVKGQFVDHVHRRDQEARFLNH
jgi:hypothetical protein